MNTNCGCDSNIQITQGTTYSQTWRWGVQPIVYKPVSAVVAETPLTVTVTAHGVPDGWPVALTELGGFSKGVNARQWPPTGDDFWQASVVDANTLMFNFLDAARFGTYTSGGLIGYYTPTNLAGSTAAFAVYPYPATDDPPVAVLTIAAVLDNTAKTITATLSPANTALLTAPQYTFVASVTDGSGAVTVLETGLIDTKALGAGP